MGQGGGQAVEDAWFLSQLLAQHLGAPSAFKAFEEKRRAKVEEVVSTSWQIGKVAHLSFGRGLRNWIMRNSPSAFMYRKMNAIYNIDY